MTSSFLSRPVLALVAALVLPAAMTNVARAADATLLTAADGPAFSIGSTPFKIVTAARAVAGSSGELAPRSQTGNGAVTVGRIGNYAIVLGAGTDSGTGVPVAQSSSSPEYLVAVNQRSGGPVLVSRRLKLFKVSADRAASVAKQTGGTVEAVVPAASMAFLQYATPGAALAAMEAIRSSSGAPDVEPEIVQSFLTPR